MFLHGWTKSVLQRQRGMNEPEEHMLILLKPANGWKSDLRAIVENKTIQCPFA